MTETIAKNERQELQALADRLKTVPEGSRKLLVHIVELACGGSLEGRKQDTAYFPELYESCGLDVEAMYELLQPLQSAGLIELENQYPFEDVRLALPGNSGWKTLPVVFHLCDRRKIPLNDVIVDLRFDLLE
jgi:hypothetical protein